MVLYFFCCMWIASYLEWYKLASTSFQYHMSTYARKKQQYIGRAKSLIVKELHMDDGGPLIGSNVHMGGEVNLVMYYMEL